MEKLISRKNYKFYTMMREILLDLELADKDYWWFINDVEAYPEKAEFEALLDSDYILLKTSDLMEMLNEDDFQWIWGIFSAIPTKYSREEILQYDFPYVQFFDEGQYNPYCDEPRIQHPLAEFEIYAVDSSEMFIVTDNEELIQRFKKCYGGHHSTL